MPNLDLTFTDTGFPTDFSGTLNDLITAYNDHLGATISTTKLILGDVTSSTAPLTNVGPWLDPINRFWNVWDGTKYIPTTIKIGGPAGVFALTLTAGTLLANSNVKMPDKDGIVAYQDDVYQGRGTKTLLTTDDINWSLFSSFYFSASADQAFSMTNSLPGQKIVVIVLTDGSARTMTFTPVTWKGAAPGAQTASQTWMYLFHNVGGTIYGYTLQNFV